MSAVRHHTTIEFFGGPCDGHQRDVRCTIDKLKPTAIVPLPFLAERRWFDRLRWMRTKSEAVYALDRSPGQCGYQYLGTVRSRQGRCGALWSRLLVRLQGACECRWRVSRRSSSRGMSWRA
jgi:hypothetical protein